MPKRSAIVAQECPSVLSAATSTRVTFDAGRVEVFQRAKQARNGASESVEPSDHNGVDPQGILREKVIGFEYTEVLDSAIKTLL